jgi:type IV pilus assembly protein PilA
MMKPLMKRSLKTKKGFTIVELMIVAALIAILAAITLGYLSVARNKGRDAHRVAQAEEFMKALELYRHDNGLYPDPSGSYPIAFSNAGMAVLVSTYMKNIPNDAIYGVAGYQYCTDALSFAIAINTEIDPPGGSNYCRITRGPNAGFGCQVWLDANALDDCSSRFRRDHLEN